MQAKAHQLQNNSASPTSQKSNTKKSLSQQAKIKSRCFAGHDLIFHPRQVQGLDALETIKIGVNLFMKLLVEIRSFHIVLRLTQLKLTGQQHKLQLDGLDSAATTNSSHARAKDQRFPPFIPPRPSDTLFPLSWKQPLRQQCIRRSLNCYKITIRAEGSTPSRAALRNTPLNSWK